MTAHPYGRGDASTNTSLAIGSTYLGMVGTYGVADPGQAGSGSVAQVRGKRTAEAVFTSGVAWSTSPVWWITAAQ